MGSKNVNVGASVAHGLRIKKRAAVQTINIGLETRCVRFNELYPVGSVVAIQESQHVTIYDVVSKPAKVVGRNDAKFGEFEAEKTGCVLINLVKRKLD